MYFYFCTLYLYGCSRWQNTKVLFRILFKPHVRSGYHFTKHKLATSRIFCHHLNSARWSKVRLCKPNPSPWRNLSRNSTLPSWRRCSIFLLQMPMSQLLRDLLGERRRRKKTWKCELFKLWLQPFNFSRTHQFHCHLIDSTMVMAATSLVKSTSYWMGIIATKSSGTEIKLVLGLEFWAVLPKILSRKSSICRPCLDVRESLAVNCCLKQRRALKKPKFYWRIG